MVEPAFLHEVDAGDIIFSMAAVRSLGGGAFYLKRKKPQLYGLLKRLMESQDYIQNFKLHNNESITHDFSTFRRGGIPYGVTLGRLHANWVGATVDWSKPWITADPSPKTKGKIVVNRTGRYQNIYFPWGKLVQSLGKHMVFVGLDAEYTYFCRSYGKIPHLRTRDLYDVAEAIAGCELFIGNQSSPNAICEGLKHNSIQETALYVPDCIYPRDNAIHCYDGNLSFEFMGEPCSFAPKRKKRISRSESPHGGWKVMVGGKEESSYCFHSLCQQVRLRMREDAPANLEEMIEEYTVSGLTIDAIPDKDMRHFRQISEIIGSPIS